jgi:integrase
MAATIRRRTTQRRDKYGNPVVSYQVRWLEPVRDEFGAPTGKFKQTSETFDTERKAKAHARKVENALESAKGVDPSSAKAKAATSLGIYARQYLDSLAGSIDPITIQGYEKIYRTHIGPVFGSKPVAAITTADVARFRAELLKPYQRSFVTRGKPNPKRKNAKPYVLHRSPKTVKHIVGTLKRILDTAVDDQAIASNPVVAGRRHTTKRRSVSTSPGTLPFAHKPLTANQVASIHDHIAQQRGNAVYALAVLFAAHTGVRAAELQGLQVQDVTLSDIPGTVGAVRVSRTATRRAVIHGESSTVRWIYGTPKSDASTDRVVPLAPWLADELRDYLTNVHPFAAISQSVAAGQTHHIPHAPLFAGKRTRQGKAVAAVEDFDWAKPIVVDNVYHNYFQPACKALGLGSVRFHDLRHSFATMNLSAGEHYMQVSKWLGHSSFVLTLTTYADYIREDDATAPKVGRGVAQMTANVVELQRRSSG